MAVYNPSLNDFYDLSAGDRVVLDGILAGCSEILEPTPLEEFDTWLNRMAKNGYIALLQPGERNARVIAAAQRSGKPVVQRTVDAPPPAAPARTVDEYLAQRGETRDAAESRIIGRFDKQLGGRPVPGAPRPVVGTVVK